MMKRILVAEDNDSNYMLMSYILKNRYECIRARNGQEAVELAESEKPDLILMDLKMPVMNGIEAVSRIKATNPSLPIIAVTASPIDKDRVEAEKVGCCDYLSKPIGNQNCLNTIAKYI